MQKLVSNILAKKLVGISVRTSNINEFNPEKAKIGAMVQKYWQEAVFNKIHDRKNPGTTVCAYLDYESDYTSEYTYFIGEEVNDFTEVVGDLVKVITPAQTYCKFTTESAPMPKVVIDAWQKIWQMDKKDLSGKRSYKVDFEIYDQRAQDMNNTSLDIYIGIEE